MKHQIIKLNTNININKIKIILFFKTKDKYENEINHYFYKNYMEVTISIQLHRNT